MSYSIVQYTGDGATATWTVPFPYISQSHVSVKVDGAAATFTWATASTVTITPTPPNGKVIEIKRSTSPGGRVVDFGNGSNLTEADMDNSAIQMFYMAQENLDFFANAITLASDGKMDAQSKKIKNVTAGVEATEAINKGQLDAAALSPVTPAASSISNTPAGNIAATTVQAALNELDTEKAIDSTVVHKAGTESIGGAKTFTSQVIFQQAVDTLVYSMGGTGYASATLRDGSGAGGFNYIFGQNSAGIEHTRITFEVINDQIWLCTGTSSIVRLSASSNGIALPDAAGALPTGNYMGVGKINTKGAYKDGLEYSMLGMGQTWTDVSASRVANNTSYQNTTGKPIMVNAAYNDGGGGGTMTAQVSTDNATWVTVSVGQSPNANFNDLAVSFIVPPSHYYRCNGVGGGGAALAYWAELR